MESWSKHVDGILDMRLASLHAALVTIIFWSRVLCRSRFHSRTATCGPGLLATCRPGLPPAGLAGLPRRAGGTRNLRVPQLAFVNFGFMEHGLGCGLARALVSWLGHRLVSWLGHSLRSQADLHMYLFLNWVVGLFAAFVWLIEC